MSDQAPPPIPFADTPPTQQKVTWAAVGTLILGLLAIAPEAAQHLLPFVPDAERPRILAGAALCGVLAGQLLNRKATSNLAGMTLGVAAREEAQIQREAQKAVGFTGSGSEVSPVDPSTHLGPWPGPLADVPLPPDHPARGGGR